VSVDPDSLTEVLLLVSVTFQEPIGFFVVTSLSQDSGEVPISHGLGGLQAAINSSKTKVRSFDLLIIKICNRVEKIRFLSLILTFSDLFAKTELMHGSLSLWLL
jgi:hypothetical protein